MKNKILFILLCFFMFATVIKAKSSYNCNKDVIVGNNIICNVKIDNDPVMIESDGNINIIKITGDSYFKKNEFQIVFYDSGTVEFGPALDKYSKYLIHLNSEDGNSSYADATSVNVVPKTTITTKKTTTTTRAKSSNNNLSDIKIDGSSLKNFDSNLLKYSINVPFETSKIKIEAIKEDELSKVEISGPDVLEVGNNVYNISVTSEDNTTKFYKIYVTKDDEISSDATIKDIIVKGYNFKLNGNSKTYHLNVNENVKELDIDAITNNDKATVNIIGNENLKNDSVIKIIVTAENNDTNTYRIIINKNNENKKSMMPYILIGITSFVIILIILIIVIKTKKDNKNKKTKDNFENLDETKTFDEFVSENHQEQYDEEKTKEVILNKKNKD